LKLAIIADIHGNAFALDQVLAVIDAERIDQVVCLGDLALLGYDPAGSIRRIADRGIPTVRGNCEDLVLNGPPMRPDTEGLGAIRNAWNRWLAEQVGDAERAFLDACPPIITVDLDGVALCAYHGSPKSYNDPIRPDTPDETLADFFAGIDAPLLAGGHTHGMMLRRWNGRTIINPGTVGLPFVRPAIATEAKVAWAEFAVVTVESGAIDITFRHVPVERAALAEAVFASGIPHPETWVEGWYGGWPN
jgi:predicted phosphodiesterase